MVAPILYRPVLPLTARQRWLIRLGFWLAVALVYTVILLVASVRQLRSDLRADRQERHLCATITPLVTELAGWIAVYAATDGGYEPTAAHARLLDTTAVRHRLGCP